MIWQLLLGFGWVLFLVLGLGFFCLFLVVLKVFLGGGLVTVEVTSGPRLPLDFSDVLGSGSSKGV